MPNFDQRESMAVQKILESGWVGPNGPEVRAFEQELKTYLNPDLSVVATQSGTSALHLALRCLKVGQGDLVVMPSFSFAAPAFACCYLGASPVFIGADPKTLNLDLNFLALALESLANSGDIRRVKAIIVVHVYGNPADLESIQKIAKQYNIPIIEDAAEAFGSSYHGFKAGTIGDLGVFSFNANKILSTGGGGCLVSKSHNIIENARYLANQAKVPRHGYIHKDIGYNYLMTSISASIGRVQLQKIDELLGERSKIYKIYKSNLGKQIGMPELLSKSETNHWITVISSKNYRKILDSAKVNKIEMKSSFVPLHGQKPFRACQYFGNQDNFRFEELICLPSGAGVNTEEVLSVLKSML